MSMRRCPPGLSPFICIRPGNPARTWRKPRTATLRPISTSFAPTSGYPQSIPSSCDVRQPPRSRRNCIPLQQRPFSQPAAAEDAPDPHTNITSESQLPTNLEKLTVKELKDLLGSLSLKTSGIKSELIERLQSAAVENVEPQDDQGMSDAVPVTTTGAEEISSAWSKMTVKDLKTRLSELGLSTTGLKGELVERLRSASSQETQATSKDETHTEQLIDKPLIAHLQDVDPTAPLEPIVIPENVETDEFTEPLDSSMVPSIPQPQTPTKPTISSEIPVDLVIPSENPIHSESTVPSATAGISALTEPQTDIESSNSAESALEPEATEGKLPISESIEMQNATTVAFSPHSSVIPTETTEITEPASLTPTPLEFNPCQKYWRPSTKVKQKGAPPPRGVTKTMSDPTLTPLEALECLQEDLVASQFTVDSTQEKVEGFWKDVTNDTILARATQFPHSPMIRKYGIPNEDLRLERTMSLAKLYFSRAYRRGMLNGPQSTFGLRFIDFAREQEAGLSQIYLNIVQARSKMETQATADDFASAWKAAMKEYAKGAGEPFVTQPKASEYNREKPRSLLEVPPRINNSELSTSTSQNGSYKQSSQKPTPAKEKSHRPSQISQKTNNVSSSSSKSKEVSREQIPRPAAAVRDQHPVLTKPNTVLNTRPRNRSEVEKLATAPVAVTLSISPEQKRAFLLLPDSDHVVGPFTTDGDPFCQIYNSMWIRLGLMDHISSIKNSLSSEDDGYVVTFKSFDAAAAFSNRVDQHWLHDALTGQVHATWHTKNGDESKRTVLLVTLPRATIEVWRREALKAGIPPTAQGYPFVEWSKAMWSVLQRMGMKIGPDKDCIHYYILWERRHRAVLHMLFQDERALNAFLRKKQDHYLTNPWKDRFFARRSTRAGYFRELYRLADNRFRPEAMGEPTEESPVPAMKDLSDSEMKSVYI